MMRDSKRLDDAISELPSFPLSALAANYLKPDNAPQASPRPRNITPVEATLGVLSSQGSGYPFDSYMRRKAVRLTGRRFQRLTGPMVYLWRRRYEVLYVGMTVRGLLRLGPTHHALKVEARDEVYLWPCSSASSAARLEVSLIRRYCPTLNKVDNPDSPQRHAFKRGPRERSSMRERFDRSELGRRADPTAGRPA